MPIKFTCVLTIATIAQAFNLGRLISSSLPQEFTIHESLASLPHGWRFDEPANEHELLTLQVALRHSNKKYITNAEEISDPLSVHYAQYMTAEQLRAALPDTRTANQSVVEWLRSHAIEAAGTGPDWVEFTTSVRKANHLLNTTFGSYRYLGDGLALRTESYGIPSYLSQYIDFVHPTVHFFTPKRTRASKHERRQHIPTGPANCSTATCPGLLKTQYNINYRPQDATSGSKIGIASFLERFPNITDVKTFVSKYGLVSGAVLPSFTPISVNGGVNKYEGADLNIEPDLDLDYSIAFTGPIPVTHYSTGGRGVQLDQPGNKALPTNQSQNEPYVQFLQHLVAQKDPPQVVSISYSDDEQSVPRAYAIRVCDLLAQAAARGISVIGASGDGGAAGSGGSSECIGPGGKHRFIPTFPSSCPWITSVGATAGYGGAASFSSGGFSNYFVRPAWQSTQVNAYIKALNGSHKAYYNASGRAIPDVSLLGDDYLTVDNGYPAVHDGTSASAPVFAAMIALINDIRLRAKQPVLGFLNPKLYAAKTQQAFHDIADDSESGGCSDRNWFEPGWQALKGWDAATGLGEPDFEKLRAALC